MKLQHHQEQLNELRLKFSDQQKRLNELNQEQGASSWLTTLPILDEGYDLTKQLFWDLIRIRYGWILTGLSTNCECGTKFDIKHALPCKKGGFISLRHNQLRNITATLLKEVCKDIQVEPQLQQLTGDILHPSTITGNEARLDICARGFSEAGQMAFFDVRVFNPTAKRYVNQEISKTYEVNEREKKKLYNERKLPIEHGISRECKKVYARLAEMISHKMGTSYSVIAAWVRRKITFSLIKSIGMCLRGSCSVFYNDALEKSLSGDAYTSELISNT